MNDRFHISRETLDKVCREALGRGASWADLYFESTEALNIRLMDSQVCNCDHDKTTGCGVRILSGEKTGYAYTDDLSEASLLKAARAACAIVQSPSAQGFQAAHVAPVPQGGFYRMQNDWSRTDCETLSRTLKTIEARIRLKDPTAEKIIAECNWAVKEVMMYNSLGELTCDLRPMGTVAVSVVYVRGSRTESTGASRSLRVGAEMIDEALIDSLVNETTEGVDALFEARRPKGGKMDVVIGAGAGGILLHEAMGHSFEADFNRKGQSVFAGRIGERICAKGIDIVDDGTLPGMRGSINYDDEGVPSQKTYMVQDGVLTSYLHDRISARFYGVEPTGNGRRESYRYAPIPRMRSTYMENGTDGTLQDIIGGVRKGVYVNKFSNGEVKIGEGDFTFFVKSGFLIEKGRLTMPVKDINIIGNGPEALAHIEAVCGDLKVDAGRWTCGKGQSVPVSCGIPSVLVKGLTVGGE